MHRIACGKGATSLLYAHVSGVPQISFNNYEAAGWCLCAIELGQKAPRYDGWNVTPMPAESIDALGGGAGLLHALSGTCAFDIDDMEAARAWWAEKGVDIDALRNSPDSVHIASGRAGRDKLLYKLSKPLRTVKPRGAGFELRCATAEGKSVQDVLPPSVHPLTKRPYEWAYGEPLTGDWRTLPNIPANVFRVWRELTDSEPVREMVNKTPNALPIERIREAAKAKLARLDIDNYDDWINLGQSIHKETGGSTAGLSLWNELSKTGKSYKNVGDLNTHWISFDVDGARGLNTPAAPDEFEVVCEAAPDEETTALVDLKVKRDKLQAAKDFLKARLVFVMCYEKFFDRETHHLFETNQGIEQMFGYLMPAKKKAYSLLVALGKDKEVVDGVGFHPGEGVVFTENGNRYVNKYRARIPKELPPTAEEQEKITWMFARIYDDAYRTWLLKFYAYAIQHPGVKIRSAPLIWSKTQGNGKSMLTDRVPAALVGDDYHVQIGADVLDGAFNDALSSAWHVSLSEFSGGSRRENDQVTKKVERWIVETKLELHQKNLGAVTIPNHFFVTASSNKENAASISNDDRKWGIHHMLAPAMTEDEMSWIFEGFLNTDRAPGVLRHYFMSLDTTGFSPSARAPLTDAKAQMVKAGEGADAEQLHAWFDERTGPFEKDIVTTAEVAQALRETLRYSPSLHRIGDMLRDIFGGEFEQVRFGKSRPHLWIIRNKKFWTNSTQTDRIAHWQNLDVSAEDPLLS